MTDVPHYELDMAAQDIFDLMRRQPGDVFTPDQLAGQLEYQPGEIDVGLRRLLDLGFVERAPGAPESFILSGSAPEL